jgi:hypothetical protein
MIAHDVISYLCTYGGFAERRISITPYRYAELEAQPLNENYRLEMREGGRAAVCSSDPDLDETAYDGGYPIYSVPNRGICARDVLAVYSAEPDWGMDDNLFLSPLQGLTGGSQGYRHMRYGLFVFRVGKAHERAVYYTHLAQRVFEKEDLYWGIRFSARALHYIQDALSPFHTKPFPECLLPVMVWRPRALYFTTYNYHLNFERLVGYYLWHGEKSFIDCIEAAQLKPVVELRSQLLKNVHAIRLLAGPLFRECRKLWGDSMSTALYKISVDQILSTRISPRMREHLCRWIGIMSGFVKGYIERYVGVYI